MTEDYRERKSRHEILPGETKVSELLLRKRQLLFLSSINLPIYLYLSTYQLELDFSAPN